jgi:hypothetical protein
VCLVALGPVRCHCRAICSRCQRRRQLLLQGGSCLKGVALRGCPQLLEGGSEIWCPLRLLLLLLLLAWRVWDCAGATDICCCLPLLLLLGPVLHHSQRHLQLLQMHLQLCVHWHGWQGCRRRNLLGLAG